MYHMRFKGEHYEIGLRFGSMAARNGKKLLDNVPYPITDERIAFGLDSADICRDIYPEIIDEIRGIADGRGGGFEALCGVVFSMYAMPPASGCSCFAYSDGKSILLCRNSDFLPQLEALNSNCIYRFEGRSKGSKSFTGNTTAFVEIEDEINSCGLAAGLTSVWPISRQPGLNGGLLVRYILEKCADVSEAVTAIKSLPISSAQTITLADSGGNIAMLECDCCGVTVISPTVDIPYVTAVNRFYHHGGPRPDNIDDWQSDIRYKTLHNGLTHHFDGSIEAARDLLSGRHGFICQYDRKEGRDTVWSVIYDIKNREIYRCEGNPDRKKFISDHRFKF